MEGECLALDESQTREVVRQGFEGKLRLQFAERGAQAIMDTLAKGEGLGRVRAVQIEHLGLREDGGVAAGCGEPEEELGACGHGTSMPPSVTGRFVTRRHTGTEGS